MVLRYNARIRVRRSVTYVRKTGLVEGPTKNHTTRTVPMPLAISAGANVKVVQKLLGHKTAVLTLDRYGHP